MKRAYLCLAVVVCCAVIVGGCEKGTSGSSGTSGEWSLELVQVIDGFDAPECVVIDDAGEVAYVSNIATPNEGYWEDDNVGFISSINPNGVVRQMRWADSTEEAPIHGPKGMTILDGWLYFNDNMVLKRCRLDDPTRVESIALEGAEKLNDLATDGESVWVSDVGASKIFRVDKELNVTEVIAPENVNGVTCHEGKVFAVSWPLHDLYEVDASGEKEPVAFGLADHFTTLDAIEVLADGSFLISDFGGDKLCIVGADRKTVKTLVVMETPADVGYDRANDLLYVPQLEINKVAIFKFAK